LPFGRGTKTAKQEKVDFSHRVVFLWFETIRSNTFKKVSLLVPKVPRDPAACSFSNAIGRHIALLK
jgi:hypothetical protein